MAGSKGGKNQKISDIVADYIAKGRVAELEKIFRNDPEVMAAVKAYWDHMNKFREMHKKFMDKMKKYDDACVKSGNCPEIPEPK